MKSRPIIGIVGGMGTAAGIHFQNLFFETCNKNGIKGDQNYPEWIYFNASKAPDRTEAIFNKAENPTPYLVESMNRLKNAGADIIVVVCNTAHSFYKEISRHVSIPWIDLQKETAKVILEKKLKSVALLSTEGTIKSGLFRKAIEHLPVKYFEPDLNSELQKKITNSIYNHEYGIKFTGSRISEKSLKLLQEVIAEINTDAVIAGCTELSLVTNQIKTSSVWLDPLKIAAQVCYNYSYSV